jgi:hypothetical protein
MAALLSGTHKILFNTNRIRCRSIRRRLCVPALIASGVSYIVSGKSSFYHALQPQRRLKTEELAVEKFFYKAKKSIPEK